MIMNATDFACWYTNTCYAHWTEWGPSTTIYATFAEARGCASYVAVITSTVSTRVFPKMEITRDPAPTSTGACA